MVRMSRGNKKLKARASIAKPAAGNPKAKTAQLLVCSYGGSMPLSRLYTPHPKYFKKCNKPAGFQLKTSCPDWSYVWVPICRSHARLWREEDIRPIHLQAKYK